MGVTKTTLMTCRSIMASTVFVINGLSLLYKSAPEFILEATTLNIAQFVIAVVLFFRIQQSEIINKSK